MQSSHSPASRAERGFSLVELMVALAVGMVLTLAVFGVLATAEGRKRVTTSAAYAGPPRFQLPRGRYYVTASARDGSSEAEIDVPEGMTTPLELRLRSGPDSR